LNKCKKKLQNVKWGFNFFVIKQCKISQLNKRFFFKKLILMVFLQKKNYIFAKNIIESK